MRKLPFMMSMQCSFSKTYFLAIWIICFVVFLSYFLLSQFLFCFLCFSHLRFENRDLSCLHFYAIACKNWMERVRKFRIECNRQHTFTLANIHFEEDNWRPSENVAYFNARMKCNAYTVLWNEQIHAISLNFISLRN